MSASETAASITPRENGPYLVEGSVRLVGPDGHELEHKAVFALCRCGGSSNKPFCDGTHARIGFQAAGVKPQPKPAQ
jgi:CDGSH-type Zn-finger protein